MLEKRERNLAPPFFVQFLPSRYFDSLEFLDLNFKKKEFHFGRENRELEIEMRFFSQEIGSKKRGERKKEKQKKREKEKKEIRGKKNFQVKHEGVIEKIVGRKERNEMKDSG